MFKGALITVALIAFPLQAFGLEVDVQEIEFNVTVPPNNVFKETVECRVGSKPKGIRIMQGGAHAQFFTTNDREAEIRFFNIGMHHPATASVTVYCW